MPYTDGIPYQSTDTSREAAESIKPDAASIRRRVFRLIEASGQLFPGDGFTCDEVEQAMHLTHQTASARIRELAQAGRIIDSGNRRLTRSGRKAIVWRAVEQSEATA